MPFLQIRDLSFTYADGGVRALDRMDLDADRGELVAVIGPNAAGKSTLALLLKGLLRRSSGSISMGGRERHEAGPDPGVGILFSNPENQLVTSIVEEDIAFGLEVAGEPPDVIRRKVTEILQRLGMTHLRGRMPHLLSGGEQQMAALAGILVMGPDVLVLDEPTAYLDPDAKGSVLAAMKELARAGKVVLWITHDMNEASLADRVVLLDGGRTVREGTPEEVFSLAGLEERYGILKPFSLEVVGALRRAGRDVPWPVEVPEIASRLRDLLPGGWSVAAPSVRPQAERGPGAELVFQGVRFRYGIGPGARQVLDGADFLAAGGALSLVCGANGSGKSTMLQMSNGLIVPEGGSVLLQGEPLARWRKARGGVPGKVALLFQNPERQLFSPTVFEDIAFGPANLGLGREDVRRRVLEAARWAGLSESLMDRPVHSLSGGQMRRTAVAGILAMETDVIVLDEPTDGLDPAGQREFFTRARRYCDDTGRTLLMATHTLPDRLDTVDNLGHLADGKMVSEGHPGETLAGSRRTLPSRFLPAHILLAGELSGPSGTFGPDILDPEAALGRILSLVGPRT